MWQNLWAFVQSESHKTVEWAKCGEGGISTVPTLLWATGAAALAHRLVAALFRRFLFRRVPLWELVLQNLLFMWMVIYSLHFWVVLVRIIKIVVEYCYDEENRLPSEEEVEGRKLMQQWIVWMFSLTPLVVYFETRPRPEAPPLMIWITTSPWQRREMGPYGYYLNRPPTTLQSTTTLAGRQHAMTLRRSFSDSKVIVKEPPKKKRYSKSV
ncbi:uncharacterized protein LOC114353813 [Ostrinia furnacalis]|uniref:uncharacterized protein LOC114353813 n=1 Tax=Ostrinia furnacalis TaxID=93504 RepID=UPI00103AC25E|nr:uncharacterized protein LOC114353813 [Ostrinia furnacalis]